MDWAALRRAPSSEARGNCSRPDNLYLNAAVDGRFAYEITGNVGDAPYLSLGTKENRYAIDGRMISTGELDKADLRIGALFGAYIARHGLRGGG